MVLSQVLKHLFTIKRFNLATALEVANKSSKLMTRGKVLLQLIVGGVGLLTCSTDPVKFIWVHFLQVLLEEDAEKMVKLLVNAKNICKDTTHFRLKECPQKAT